MGISALQAPGIQMLSRMSGGKEHQGNSNYVYLIGADKLSSDLHNISSKCNKVYTKLNNTKKNIKLIR